MLTKGVNSIFSSIHFDESAPKNEEKIEVKDEKSVKEAVDKAAKELAEKAEPKKEEKKEEKAEVKEGELTDEELVHAKELFKTLKDPEQGVALLRILAKEAGITEESKKEEKKEAAKTIESILTQHLGEEFPGLAKLLIPAIKEAVELVADEKTKDLRLSASEREKAELNKEIDAAMEVAFGEFENCDEKVIAKVSELMDELKPTDRDMKKYFRRLVKIAADDLNVTLKKKTTEVKDNSERRERNRNDATSRMASDDKTTGGGKSEVKEIKSLDEAIKQAQADIAAGKK